MIVQSYRDLDVWKKSMDFAEAVYAVTDTFPKEERYGLSSQLQRAVVSVPSNIAEGRSKRTTRDFMRFLNIAYGSLAEAETQLMLAGRRRYCADETVQHLLEQSAEIGRMVNGLLSSLEKKLPPSTIPAPRIPTPEPS